MSAPKGNKFWELRDKHGRNGIYQTPAELWECAVSYFEWVESHPILEMKPIVCGGEIVEQQIPKLRAMTLDSLCFYLGVSDDTWRNYCKKEDFIGVTSEIAKIIKAQKFEGAAAGLLNANIIARDLQLRDLKSNEVSGPNGEPIDMDHTFTIEFINAPSEG